MLQRGGYAIGLAADGETALFEQDRQPLPDERMAVHYKDTRTGAVAAPMERPPERSGTHGFEVALEADRAALRFSRFGDRTGPLWIGAQHAAC